MGREISISRIYNRFVRLSYALKIHSYTFHACCFVCSSKFNQKFSLSPNFARSRSNRRYFSDSGTQYRSTSEIVSRYSYDSPEPRPIFTTRGKEGKKGEERTGVKAKEKNYSCSGVSRWLSPPPLEILSETRLDTSVNIATIVSRRFTRGRIATIVPPPPPFAYYPQRNFPSIREDNLGQGNETRLTGCVVQA